MAQKRRMKCLQQNHEESISRFCLFDQCEAQNRLACIDCLEEKGLMGHLGHQDKCVRFQKVIDLANSIPINIDQYQHNLKVKFKEIDNRWDSFKKNINQILDEEYRRIENQKNMMNEITQSFANQFILLNQYKEGNILDVQKKSEQNQLLNFSQNMEIVNNNYLVEIEKLDQEINQQINNLTTFYSIRDRKHSLILHKLIEAEQKLKNQSLSLSRIFIGLFFDYQIKCQEAKEKRVQTERILREEYNQQSGNKWVQIHDLENMIQILSYENSKTMQLIEDKFFFKQSEIEQDYQNQIYILNSCFKNKKKSLKEIDNELAQNQIISYLTLNESYSTSDCMMQLLESQYQLELQKLNEIYQENLKKNKVEFEQEKLVNQENLTKKMEHLEELKKEDIYIDIQQTWTDYYKAIELFKIEYNQEIEKHISNTLELPQLIEWIQRNLFQLIEINN